jgi:glycosyltransferase involved in cell wall biosynthesis
MDCKARVCMISCTHSLYDDRIYWKEALSLKKLGYDVCHIGIGNENKEFLSEDGIKLIHVKRISIFKNSTIDKIIRNLFPRINVYRKILKAAAGLKADVYHLHDLQINKIGRKLKKLPHNPRIIYDVHEPYPETIRYSVSNNLFSRIINWIFSVYIYYWELRCSRYYDFIISTEENVYNKFKNYLKTDNVDIIYNYSDLHLKTDGIAFEKKEYDAIYCGGIKSVRGIFEIIEAMRIAIVKLRNLKFLIIGPVIEKGLKKQLTALIEKYKLSENIILKDPVPYNRIHEFYYKSRIGLAVFLDNPINHIILPIKLFEYMAFGLPVVCSNFGHLAEYVNENDTGKLVNPSNPAEIYNAIVEILDNKIIYNQYRDNGKRAANKKYNWSLMENKLKDIYSNII